MVESDAEASLQLAQETGRIGTWVSDPENDTLEWSAETYRIFGCDPGTFNPTHPGFYGFVHPDDRAAVSEASRTALESGEDYHIEHRIVRTDGQVRVVLEHARIYRGRRPAEATRMFGTIQDITDRWQAEQELSQRNRQLALLASASNELLLSDTPETALQHLCEQAMRELDCQAFFLYLNGNFDGRLRLHAFSGVDPEEAKEIQWLDPRQAGCGAASREGQRSTPGCVQQCASPIFAEARRSHLRAHACSPLTYRGKVIGTLAFGTRSRDRFNSNELALMESFSNQVAIALGRTFSERELRELHSKEQEYSEMLEAQVLMRTQELAKANQELTRQNDMLQELAKELTETEQRERQRIAEKIHEDLQQLLVGSKLRATALRMQAEGSSSLGSTAKELEALLEQSIAKARSLSYEISPPILRHSELGQALAWAADRIQQLHGLNLDVQIQPGLPGCEEPVKVFLFSAVSELLLNVVKHSEAREARIRLACERDQLAVRVEDHGKGFNLDSFLSRGPNRVGFGLGSIERRLTVFGGRMEVETKPGEGTAVTLRVPLLIPKTSAPLYHGA
jgi:PAS domain S-box-containing protein